MPRRKNTRPTLIYWLFDMRPETIVQGWHAGRPFYCGKTVYSIEKRVKEHRIEATRKPDRLISKWLVACREHVRIQIMEVVPPEVDWAVRERHWIRILRFSFPGGANTTDGGQGPAGRIVTDEQKARMRAGNIGKKRSPETCKRIAKAVKESWRKKRIEKRRVLIDTVDAYGNAVKMSVLRSELEPPPVKSKEDWRWRRRKLKPRMTDAEYEQHREAA